MSHSSLFNVTKKVHRVPGSEERKAGMGKEQRSCPEGAQGLQGNTRKDYQKLNWM